MKKQLTLLLALLAFASMAFAQYSPSGTSTLNVNIQPEIAIQITDSSVNLTNSGGFTDFTGTTRFLYKVRSGTMTTANVKVLVAEFTGGGTVKPSVAANELTYTSTIEAPGSGVGATTASTGTPTVVATFGAGAKKSAGNGSVAWTLVNNPDWDPGSYSAVATFTASLT